MYDSVTKGREDSAIDRPTLAKIADLAEEVERIGGYIEDFVARCRGNETAQGGGQLAPVPCGHFGQLDRLSMAVGRADAIARELQTIG